MLTVTDFSIAATPTSQSVSVLGTASYTVTITALNGFTGAVSLSASGAPPNATVTFTPSSVTGSGPSTMAVTTTSSTPAGTYTITITGTSGSLSHSTTVSLTVTDFSIAATPTSQPVSVLGTASYTVTITALNGFAGAVSLSANRAPP